MDSDGTFRVLDTTHNRVPKTPADGCGASRGSSLDIARDDA